VQASSREECDPSRMAKSKFNIKETVLKQQNMGWD
jgi:hypothetical protein